jgi:cullin 2
MVTMQTFQMAIMLVFEDHDTFKYTEIQELLQLNIEQFQKHINSLIECKLLLINGDVSRYFQIAFTFLNNAI